MRALILATSVCGLLLVVAGAIAGHSGPPPFFFDDEAAALYYARLSDRQATLTTALLFGFIHTLAALQMAMLPLASRLRLFAGWAFVAGACLFSGPLSAIAMSGNFGSQPIGAFVFLIPAGGIAFMLGWILLGAAALTARRSA